MSEKRWRKHSCKVTHLESPLMFTDFPREMMKFTESPSLKYISQSSTIIQDFHEQLCEGNYEMKVK